MLKSTTCLLVALLLATSGMANAGERPGAFFVSPFVGGTTFDGVERLETRPTFGLRLGYDFTKYWAAELTSNYTPTHPKDLGTLIDIVNYRLEGIYNFSPDQPLTPYLAVGGGGQSIIIGDHSNTYPTANIGAGIKYFFNDDIAFRGDFHTNFIVNHNVLDRRVKNDFLVNYEYTVGVQVLFGGVKPAPAKVAAAEPPAAVAAAEPPPPPVPSSKLSVGPGSIRKGEKTTLSWASQNATNCEIQPDVGQVQPQGSVSVSPSADTSYTLSCSGAGGATTSDVAISVIPPQAPTTTMSAAPSSIAEGETVALNWKAENADNCEMTPSVGPIETEGSINVTPTSNTSYVITCSGAGGATTSKADVMVSPPQCPVVLSPEQAETVNLKIEFDNDKTEIKPEYYPNLAALGEFLKKYPSCEITIEGHTDATGTAAHNQVLSEQRAVAVKRYLADKFGIDPDKIKTVGYGETKPLDTSSTVEARKKNRRIQVYHPAVKQ